MASENYDLVITGGRIIDPALGFGSEGHIFVSDGKISKIDKDGPELQKEIAELPDTKKVDATGKLVVPGLVDIHVHLREPGNEYAETIESGCRAAAAGGFTSICCMPNTNPRIDNQETVQFVLDRARHADSRVYVVGSITKNGEGKQLAEIGELVKSGAVAITDDGYYVQNPEIMRRAMEYSIMFDIPVMEHAEDNYLCAGGVMNESYQSTRLGLKGAPAVAEEIAVERDISLARMTGARLHIQHVSAAGSVHAIRRAKEEGVKVTAEVTPHHLILTDEEIGKEFNTNLRVNPPLRTQVDRDAVIAGLVDGTIDCIACDHAPHLIEDKDSEFDKAPPGMIGMETSLALIKTYIIDKGYLGWADAIRKMTVNPARILNLPAGSLKQGEAADIAIIDPDMKWTVTVNDFQSLSQNSPYLGWDLVGRVTATIMGGRIVYQL
ncbi:amidohydrolase family protein [candidate division GN15 bacterium]|nr:amidohydrolase family protein [candidate division GN15 bacterium]